MGGYLGVWCRSGGPVGGYIREWCRSRGPVCGVGPEVRRVDISGCDVGPEVRRVDISGGGPSSLGPCMVKFVSLEALPEGRTFFSLI